MLCASFADALTLCPNKHHVPHDCAAHGLWAVRLAQCLPHFLEGVDEGWSSSESKKSTVGSQIGGFCTANFTSCGADQTILSHPRPSGAIKCIWHGHLHPAILIYFAHPVTAVRVLVGGLHQVSLIGSPRPNVARPGESICGNASPVRKIARMPHADACYVSLRGARCFLHTVCVATSTSTGQFETVSLELPTSVERILEPQTEGGQEHHPDPFSMSTCIFFHVCVCVSFHLFHVQLVLVL